LLLDSLHFARWLVFSSRNNAHIIGSSFIHVNPTLKSTLWATLCLPDRPLAPMLQVDKLTYPFTGKWWIIAKLHGTSYKIKHCLTKAKEKKHALDLSPYLVELISFCLINNADNQYSQLYWKFKEHPYKEAGIKGFMPLTPFVVPTQFLMTNDALSFTWPTLAMLNDELYPNLGWSTMRIYMTLTISLC
jgi:hypothetical protein